MGKGITINLKSQTVELSVPKGSEGQKLAAQLRGQKLPANGVAANSTAQLAARFLSHTFDRVANKITFKIGSANMTASSQGFSAYLKSVHAGGVVAFPSKAPPASGPSKNTTCEWSVDRKVLTTLPMLPHGKQQ